MSLKFCIANYKRLTGKNNVNILTDDKTIVDESIGNVNFFVYENPISKNKTEKYHPVSRLIDLKNIKIDICASADKKFFGRVNDVLPVKLLYDNSNNKCYDKIVEQIVVERPKSKLNVKSKSVTFITVDFNTSKLTNTLIKSIYKNVKSLNYNIVVFDNSDRQKFVLDEELEKTGIDIKIYDNTQNQLIDFKPLIEKYIVDKNFGKENNYGSFKHTVTIDYLLTKVPEVGNNAILCDSDIIIKKDIDFIDETKISVGSLDITKYKNLKRICPYFQYINKKMMNEIGLKYFDHQLAYGCSFTLPYTDTGYSMLKEIEKRKLPLSIIDMQDYYVHLKGASFRKEKMDKIDKFIDQNRQFYDSSVLFFTAVDKKYEKFVFPYIYFANRFNLFSKFEIVVVDDRSDRIKKMKETARKLSQKLKCSILIRNPKTNGFFASKIRFVEEPETKCEYTYCGDIDIMILENIVPFHVSQMELYGTIFDNVIRYNDEKRLSGLHFVKTDEYYQKTQKIRSNIENIECDEMLLKNICSGANLKFKPKSVDATDFSISRPVHGFHVSLNRKPFLKNSELELNLSIYNFKLINEIINSAEYKTISKKFFDDEFNDILDRALKFINKDKFDFKNLTFPRTDKKYVIYTCQIGNYEDQRFNANDIYDTEHFDYFYFTDNPSIKLGKAWKVIDISKFNSIFPDKIKNDNTRIARFIKTHPHLFFENYERSIWIDANMHFVSSPYDFIQSIDDNCIFTSVKHPLRSCIYQEAVAVVQCKKDGKTIVDQEIECIKHNLYPERNGLIESGIIVRNHNNAKCISIMEQWWVMIENYSRRDQLAFDYISWKNQFAHDTISYDHRCKITKLIPHKHN